MLWSEYTRFVIAADSSASKPEQARRDIAIYGLAAEIGSLLAVVKKAMLTSEEREGPMDARRRQQVEEEIGDVLWYVSCLSRLSDAAGNPFHDDIRNLRKEISASDQRAARIERELTPEVKVEFLGQAAEFLERADFELDDYQRLASLTARTRGALLERVCLAVLTQLGAEVLRKTLPTVELDLNRKLADRDLSVILGEVVWHLAAVATVSRLTLNQIAEANRAKGNGRYKRTEPTPLPDEQYPPHERFPREMEVCFVSVGKGRSQMYFEGRPLGNDLTDNAAEEDGYRFHDVMHLAILAKLGWSPVLRKLMGRKRKSDPAIDEVQDGARAQIVEELVIKSIHSEVTADLDAARLDPASLLFASEEVVPFRFLSQVSRLTEGLEAGRNQPWEWEEAILEGSRLFQELRLHGRGTVRLDLRERSISFEEDVYVDLPGAVVGVGSAAVAVPDPAATTALRERESEALAEAVLAALGFGAADANLRRQLEVRQIEGGGLVVRTAGAVQVAAWKRRAVSFKVTWTRLGGAPACMVLALSDVRSLAVP